MTEFAQGTLVEIKGEDGFSAYAGFRARVATDWHPDDGPIGDEDIFLVPTVKQPNNRSFFVRGLARRGFYWVSSDLRAVEPTDG